MLGEKFIKIPYTVSEVLELRSKGNDYHQIALKLGITRNAVTKRLHRFAATINLSKGKDLYPYLCHIWGIEKGYNIAKNEGNENE